MVFGARYEPVLQGDGCRERRAGTSFEMEPVLLRSRNGTLRRWPGTRSVRSPGRDGRLGRERNRARLRNRDREGIPRPQPAIVRLSKARPIQGSGRYGKRKKLRVPLIQWGGMASRRGLAVRRSLIAG